jgi:hypothetical protein
LLECRSPLVRLHLRRHQVGDIVSASLGLSLAEQALAQHISPRRMREAKLAWPGDQDRLALELCHFVGDARSTHLGRRIALFLPAPDAGVVQSIGPRPLADRAQRQQPAAGPQGRSLGVRPPVAQPKSSTPVPTHAAQLLALGPDASGLIVPLVQVANKGKEVDWIDWLQYRQDRLTEPAVLQTLLNAWRAPDSPGSGELSQSRSMALARMMEWAGVLEPWLVQDARLAAVLVLETALRMAVHCVEAGGHRVMPGSVPGATGEAS